MIFSFTGSHHDAISPRVRLFGHPMRVVVSVAHQLGAAAWLGPSFRRRPGWWHYFGRPGLLLLRVCTRHYICRYIDMDIYI